MKKKVVLALLVLTGLVNLPSCSLFYTTGACENYEEISYGSYYSAEAYCVDDLIECSAGVSTTQVEFYEGQTCSDLSYNISGIKNEEEVFYYNDNHDPSPYGAFAN